MAVKISSLLNDQQFNSNGTLLSGGKIETFLAGSSTPATTFTTDAGNIAQSNPIILNTRGEVPNSIYLTTGVKYKLVLKDSVNNVLRTYDNIEGVNDSATGIDQWVNSSVAPVFINTTTFTLAGDQTNNFHVNRRVKLLVTAGTLYGFISASVFTTLTTVTVVLDSGVLDSGLSSVQLGLITPVNSSLRATDLMIANAAVTNTKLADNAVTPIKLSVGAPIWSASGQLTVILPSSLGYGVGAGGAVTQGAGKGSTVTLNRPAGVITMNNAALGAGAVVSFAVINSVMSTTDVVVLSLLATSVVDPSAYRLEVRQIDSGSFVIRLTNTSAGALSEALIINFAIIKGANA